jgi:hypothetical protein
MPSLLLHRLERTFQDGIHSPLYSLFIGLLMATIVALVLALSNLSLHMMGNLGALDGVMMSH